MNGITPAVSCETDTPTPSGLSWRSCRGHDLPTAPLGFPDPLRPKCTAGHLGLGIGLQPDVLPDAGLVTSDQSTYGEVLFAYVDLQLTLALMDQGPYGHTEVQV